VSTSAILESAGVGNAQATALSAAMAWATRDGIGMVGGLCFSFFASDLFDSHVKEFRLFADIVNDIGLTLDMLAPYMTLYYLDDPTKAQSYTLYILSLSTICKTMCGMAAGSTKGRITQHFSKHGNMADLTAKESTQETLVSLMGMMGGMLLAKFLNTLESNKAKQEFATWSIFLVLTLIHVWANYKGVVLLKLTSLNPERCRMLFRDLVFVMGTEETDGLMITLSNNTISGLLPTPDEINESFFTSISELIKPTIHFGDPFSPVHYDLISEFQNYKYVIGRRKRSGGRSSSLCVSLTVGAQIQDELEAYLHAKLLHEMISNDPSLVWNSQLINR
jgi:hypothetical protein